MQLNNHRFTSAAALTVAVLFAATAARADVIDEAKESFRSGDYDTVVALATREIEKNPGDEEAYILLAQTYEKLGDKTKAAEFWGEVKKISTIEERRRMARLGLLRTRGPLAPRDTSGVWDEDPFKVDVGKIDWRGTDVVESTQYQNGIPPFAYETDHFIIFSCNQRLSELAGDLSEQYLAFLLNKFLDGRAWAQRVPIFIYKDHNDYVSVGRNPASSAGVTFGDHRRLGRSSKVALYMLDEDGNFDKDNFIGVLPHELTHVVMNEFFGSEGLPRWLNEALARRMEQPRNHYEEAAKTGRDAVAGEYYRFRDLFATTEYPEGFFRTWRFYEQSATIVLFLLEHGPESMLAFLETLRDEKDHDRAIANALGIPEEGAIEELEKRWVAWMEKLYARYLAQEETSEVVEAESVEDELSLDSFDKTATIEHISKWTTVETDSLDAFKGLGHSRDDWSVRNGHLFCGIRNRSSGAPLGVRLNEEPPMVLRFKIQLDESPGRDGTVFGISMLDHRGDDTGIQVMVRLNDKRVHSVTCVVTDYINIYLDDQRMGRAPALRTESLDEDIDYPLAMVAYSPVEVWSIEASIIEEFAVKVAAAPKEDGG